ncbi:Nitrogen permease regulator-like 3 [Saguinus oedipus]|uniref:Nitrogen permease regulator-like 3 n=1 Tax=Saguinus oedipus TaxID=9490 RepID=A0ABQ9UJA5_SAGOE|nr:Nitrogen permease regulator-like 3 [Saguinus oedipus]
MAEGQLQQHSVGGLLRAGVTGTSTSQVLLLGQTLGSPGVIQMFHPSWEGELALQSWLAAGGSFSEERAFLPGSQHREYAVAMSREAVGVGMGTSLTCCHPQTQLIQMVVWMLQRRLLIQLHTYVCLMASPSEEEPRLREDDVPFTARLPPEGRLPISQVSREGHVSHPGASSDDMTLTSPSMDNSSAELLPSGDSPLNQRMTENLLASLSEHERAAILSVPAAQNPEDLRMFARLLHYFRGRHHLEEIMYNENTRRSQLLMLFDKFRSVLVVTTHEDPVIAVFQALLP